MRHLRVKKMEIKSGIILQQCSSGRVGNMWHTCGSPPSGGRSATYYSMGCMF